MSRRETGLDVISIILVFSLYAFGCYSGYNLESLLIFFVLAIVLNLCCYRKRKLIIPKLLILLLVFQNLFLGVFSHISGKVENISLMTQFAFVFCLISFVTAIISEKKLSKLDIGFIFFCVILFILFLTTTADKMSAIVYLRNFITFYLAYFVGKFYIDTREKNEKFINFLIITSVIVVVLGLIMIKMPLSFWQNIGVHEVYIAKRNPFPEGQLPARFFTNFLSDNLLMRMASVYYEPVNLSYLLTGTITLMLCIKKTEKKYLSLGIIALGALLTFGKGGLLYMGLLIGITLGQMLLKQITSHFPSQKIVTFCVVAILIMLVVISVLYFVLVGGTSVYHFYGIFQSIPFILQKPAGYGIGNGGNIGALSGSYAEGIDLLSSGGESGLMSMLFQLGIFVGAYFMILWFKMGKELVHTDNTIFSKNAKYYLRFVPIFLLIVSIFQENTYTPQCIVPIMLGVGGLSNMCKKCSERRNCSE